jgi:hypothetical protein
MSDKTDTTILLDIYERLGTIEQQLRTLTSDHKDMEEEMEDLKQFKSKVGAYIWMGGLLVSGVLTLLWQGLKYAADKWLH